jgi:predicted lipoprotein with Yx(FWY)xxD motif
MPSNNRSHAARAAAPGTSLVATAVALGMLAVLAFFFLRPVAGNAAPGTAGPVVSTASTGLGRVLVNSSGRTLYMLSADKNDKSSCSGMCASFWPPLIASGKPRAVAGAKASLVGTTKRSDGRMQVTYKRHPLYTFVKDTKKGQTNGEGVNAFGGVWDAVSPAGAKVVKHAAPAAGAGGAYGP